ncbi:MAG TPA: LysM peptidoglycan-binding domain-containing protein [Gemmataceae bacterium]|nr:LysM peptidoglycan-binding domain-containing protein [Gemmataceae bacterium]
MPNDAKLAMVIGVGIVVAVAIVFFHKDLINGYGSGDRSPANGVNAPDSDPSAPGGGPRRLTAARPTSQVKAAIGSRRHTVAEGDTLYGLAEQYYGDGEHFIDIYDANRDVLKRPDRLEAGTVLAIPDLPAAP